MLAHKNKFAAAQYVTNITTLPRKFYHGQNLDGYFVQFTSNLNQTLNLLILSDSGQSDQTRAAVLAYMSTIASIALFMKILLGGRVHCR